MSKVGDRVGAIHGFGDDGDTVEFFGYGVYEGDFPFEPFGGIPNPRIKLDSGATVWGAESWWGPEHVIKNKLAEYEEQGLTVVTIDIDKLRQEAA
jgi:hypothetical protein